MAEPTCVSCFIHFLNCYPSSISESFIFARVSLQSPWVLWQKAQLKCVLKMHKICTLRIICAVAHVPCQSTIKNDDFIYFHSVCRPMAKDELLSGGVLISSIFLPFLQGKRARNAGEMLGFLWWLISLKEAGKRKSEFAA